MISKRFDLLLKSYMRHCSFTRKELSKLLQIKDLDLYLKHPFKIPTPSFVLKVINVLQIPDELVWRSYFNSIYYHFYQEGNIVLVDYKKYKNMVDENYKKHKKLNSKSYPSEEVWRDDNLNGFDFYFYSKKIMKKTIKNYQKSTS